MTTATESIVRDWDVDEVNQWLSSIGYTQYHSHIIEHEISGEVLVQMDHESLKDVGVSSLGQRLAILKAVYHLKIAHHMSIEPDDYVPPSEAVEHAATEHPPLLDAILDMIHDQDARIRVLEEENEKLHYGLESLEEILAVKPSHSAGLNSNTVSLRKQHSFKWASLGKTVKSPTRPMPEDTTSYSHNQESPRISPQTLEHDTNQNQLSTAQTPKLSEHHLDIAPTPPTIAINPASLAAYPTSATPSQMTLQGDRSQLSRSHSVSVPESKSRSASSSNPGPAGEDRAENQFKSFKVSLDDPCWKVLPAALKKYKINDDWRQYAMFICYGNTERCLSYDEKPLLLFQKLKDANKNPVFMLRHIKDIRSPIAVAQQKQADRQSQTSPPPYSHPTPPRKQENNAKGSSTGVLGSPANNTSYARNTRLHQTPPEAMQPVTNKGQGTSTHGTLPTAASNNGLPWPESTSGIAGEDSSSRSRLATDDISVQASGPLGPAGHADAVILSTGISYAIAIYPYMAEQEDEFDVIVGSTFIIYSRAKGWWFVQRDPTGSGMADETAKQGWVPAGCLLETNVPPATAVSEVGHQRVLSVASSVAPPAYSSGLSFGSEMAATNGTNAGGSPLPVAKAPILPSYIISTSFPGVALMDYAPKGDHELELSKDDLLRVFKRYNHWSYAVKEETGDRGWVPSWLIGKVSTGPVPPTPNTITSHSTTQGGESRFDVDDAHPVGGRAVGHSHSNGTNGYSSHNAATQASPLSPGFPTTNR